MYMLSGKKRKGEIRKRGYIFSSSPTGAQSANQKTMMLVIYRRWGDMGQKGCESTPFIKCLTFRIGILQKCLCHERQKGYGNMLDIQVNTVIYW